MTAHAAQCKPHQGVHSMNSGMFFGGGYIQGYIQGHLVNIDHIGKEINAHWTPHPCYSHSKEQEQVFRGVLAALRICSLAKWAQGLSEMVLVLSHVATKQWSQAVAGVFDTLDALVVAGLLMIVMRSFEGIIKTSGHDISLLLDALGPKLGIAKLFAEFADVALFLALAQIGQVCGCRCCCEGVIG